MDSLAQFTNQARLAYNDAVINSNVAVGEILEVLSANKTAVSATYNGDDSITYVISILNSGTTAYTNLTVSDNLGAYAFDTQTLIPLTYVDGSVNYFVNGTLQASPAVTVTGDTLEFSGINVPAGGNAIIVYEAKANQFAPLAENATITNTATVNGAGTTTAVTADATVTAASEPKLSITKTITPVPVTENGTLTYTFVIQNSGNTAATAADLAVITDTFDPILSNLTVTFNNDTWALTTDYTYDETTGEFATVPGVITVPAATFEQDAATGAWITTPGVSTLVVSGTV